jgi:DNA-directed RNA polymerase III subunit RPC4
MNIDDDKPLPEDLGEVNASNALDLSETEDEEEMEDLINDFSIHNEPDEVFVIYVSFYDMQFTL